MFFPALLSFGIPFLIMLSTFIAYGIFPFGNEQSAVGDMWHQYVPFFAEFARKLKCGSGLGYSFNLGGGTDFYQLFVYYLSCPLNFAAIFLSPKYIMDYMAFLQVLKVGLAGLCAWIYFRKCLKTESFSAVVFSTLYALCGYCCAYNYNLMWMDNFLLFPLIILFLEKLVDEKKPLGYILTLGLSVYVDYYISIMICIFLVFYFFGLIYIKRQGKYILKHVFRFGISSLMAGIIAAIHLIPCVIAMRGSKFGTPTIPDGFKSYFSVLKALGRHCICVGCERGLNHFPNIFCGCIVFILVPYFILSEGISLRKKFVMLGLSLFLMLSFCVDALALLWHGMNYPDSLPARHSFIYCFLIITMCCDAFKHLKECSKKVFAISVCIGALGLILMEACSLHEGLESWNIWVTLLFVIFSSFLLWGFVRNKRKTLVTVLFIVLCVCECTLNLFVTGLDSTDRTEYTKEYDDRRVLVEKYGGENVRFEGLKKKTKNDGTYYGYPSASSFSSTMNSSFIDFYKCLGMRHSKVFYCVEGMTPVCSGLLNIKYLFGKEGEESNLYKYKDSSNEVFLYENPYNFGPVYCLPYETDIDVSSSLNPMAIQNDFVKSCGTDPVFDCVATQKDKVVNFEADEAGTFYAEFISQTPSKIYLERPGQNKDKEKIKDLKNRCVLCLGDMKSGDRVKIYDQDEDSAKIIKVNFYRLNMDALNEWAAQMKDFDSSDTFIKDGKVRTHVKLDESKRVVIPVAKDGGWRIKINGKTVEPEYFGDLFYAFDLKKGEYDIEMTFTNRGRLLGLVISVFGIIIVGIFTIVKNKKKLFSNLAELSQE